MASRQRSCASVWLAGKAAFESRHNARQAPYAYGILGALTRMALDSPGGPCVRHLLSDGRRDVRRKRGASIRGRVGGTRTRHRPTADSEDRPKPADSEDRPLRRRVLSSCPRPNCQTCHPDRARAATGELGYHGQEGYKTPLVDMTRQAGEEAACPPTANPNYATTPYYSGYDPHYPDGYQTPSTGLLQVGARDYDPAAGRWLQPDPVAVGPEVMSGIQNRWAYCANDPVNRSDPTGTIAPALAIGVLLLIVGAALEEVLSRALLNSTLRLLGKWMCSRLLDQVYGFGLLGLVGMGLIAIGLIIGRIPGLGLLGVPFALVGYILLGFSLLVTAAFDAIWDWIVASSYQTKRAEYDLFNDHYALLHGSVALLPFQPNTGNYPTRLVEQVRV